MNWLVNWYRAFFFTPTGPTNLGVCRAIFFGLILIDNWGYRPEAWASVGLSFWEPIPLFSAFGLHAWSATSLRIAGWVWLVALASSAIGLATRLSTIIAAILGVYLLGLPQNFGKIHHNDTLVAFILAIMAFSRCGEACSVDRFIRQRRGDRLTAEEVSGEYTWPIRLIWVLMSLLFFAAGVAKLRAGGLAWVFSDNMSRVLIMHHYTGHHPPLGFGLAIARYSVLCQALAAGVVVAELCAPLALFSWRARVVLLPGLLVMQIANWLLLGVLFKQYFYCYLMWMPWDRVVRSFRGHITSGDASGMPPIG